MADEKKKISGGVIAAIVAVVVAAIVAVVAVVVINVTKNNIVGKYAMTAIVDSEGNEQPDAMKVFEMLGAKYELELKDDKTGVLEVTMDPDKLGSFASSFVSTLSGSDTEVSSDTISSSGMTNGTITFTYDDKKFKGTGNFNSLEFDYEVKDGAVIVDMSGERLKFVKK